MADHGSTRKSLSRRDFLRTTGATLAAGSLGAQALGRLAGAAASPAAGAAVSNPNGFERAGIWYFHPSIFEYAIGPWQPALPVDVAARREAAISQMLGGKSGAGSNPSLIVRDLVALWKQAIDWFSDNGLDFIVLHCAPYGDQANPSPIRIDRVRFGWGYHYTLNFKKYPEARVFEPDFVKRNQEIVRGVTEYGKAKGVDVFFHHYNFMMTMPFLKAHPELVRFEFLRKGNFVDLNKDKIPSFPINPHSAEGKLAFNVCWNKPLYQDFMKSCFQEFFEKFPAAAGILVTPGERALCQCVYCIGERGSPEEAVKARFQDSPEKRKTIASFCDLFGKTLSEAGKTPLIRSWITGVLDAPEAWAAALPKGPTYVTKYSVFDMTDTGVDPLSKAFQRAGHKVWLMKEYIGSENAGPVVMTLPESFDRIAEACRKDKIEGVMGVDNGEHGLTFKSRRVQYVPEILFANSFGRKRRGKPEKVATEAYTAIFGEAGPELLKAVELYSWLPYEIDRTIWERTEGFTWRFPYHFADFGGKPKQSGFPGILGPILDPPDWARREVVPLSAYIAYAHTKPWTDKFRARVTGKGKDPIEFLEGYTAMARKSVDALKALAPRVRAGLEPEYGILLDSANLVWLTGVKWSRFVSARLYYEGALGPNPLGRRKTLAQKAVAEYKKGLEATEKMLPILESFPNSVIDPSISVPPLEKDIEKRHLELGYIQEALASVIGPAPEPMPAAPSSAPAISGGGRA